MLIEDPDDPAAANVPAEKQNQAPVIAVPGVVRAPALPVGLEVLIPLRVRAPVTVRVRWDLIRERVIEEVEPFDTAYLTIYEFLPSREMANELQTEIPWPDGIDRFGFTIKTEESEERGIYNKHAFQTTLKQLLSIKKPDVTLVVYSEGRKDEIKVHKFILTKLSSIFEEEFENSDEISIRKI